MIGYITKGNGISVHRRCCHNLEYLDNRIIRVDWNSITSEKYETVILVHSNTTENKILEMIQKMSMFDIRIDRFLTMHDKDDTIYEITLYVQNLECLEKIFKELEKLSYVIKIERLIR